MTDEEKQTSGKLAVQTLVAGVSEKLKEAMKHPGVAQICRDPRPKDIRYAIAALRAGQCVRRKAWGEKQKFLYMHPDEGFRQVLESESRIVSCWDQSTEDIFAEDWEIVEIVGGKKVAPKVDFELFGREVWAYICKQGSSFCEAEISEDLLPLAKAAGLCQRVKYDPALHGDDQGLFEPGDEMRCGSGRSESICLIVRKNS